MGAQQSADSVAQSAGTAYWSPCRIGASCCSGVGGNAPPPRQRQLATLPACWPEPHPPWVSKLCEGRAVHLEAGRASFYRFWLPNGARCEGRYEYGRLPKAGGRATVEEKGVFAFGYAGNSVYLQCPLFLRKQEGEAIAAAVAAGPPDVENRDTEEDSVIPQVDADAEIIDTVEGIKLKMQRGKRDNELSTVTFDLIGSRSGSVLELPA